MARRPSRRRIAGQRRREYRRGAKKIALQGGATMSMEITGIRETRDALAQLGAMWGEAVMLDALYAAMIAAAEPMAAAMARGAPSEDGFLASHIKVSRWAIGGTVSGKGKKRTSRAGRVIVYIGPTVEAYWGLYLEFGTRERIQFKTGKSVGAITPRPYVRPGFDASAPSVLAALGPKVRIMVERFAEEAARKAGSK